MKNNKILIGFAFFSFIFLISLLAAAEYWGEAQSRIYIKEGIFCLTEYNRTRWVDTITQQSYPTVNANPVFDCRDFQQNGFNFAGEGACCPRASSAFTTCQLVSSNEFSVNLLPMITGVSDRYACILSDITSCSSYKTKNECKDYSPDVAEYSIESSSKYGDGWCNKHVDTPWEIGGKICSNFTSCDCIWNATENKCLAEARKIKECNNGDNDTYNFCQYAITVDDSQCTQPNGIITKTWQVINQNPSNPPLNCDAGNEEEPCTDMTRLEFFNWMNIIAVIIVLVVIYYVYIKHSKIKRKKKK